MQRKRNSPLVARALEERFSPVTGVPLRIGALWPPRMVVHNVATKADADQVVIRCTAWFRHHLREAVQIRIEPDGPAVDPRDWPAPGLQVSPVGAEIPPTRVGKDRGLAGQGYHPLPIELTWDRSFVEWIQDVEWVRQPLRVVLTDGKSERVFRWYAYITPHAAQLPAQASQFDDHPHFRWMDPEEGPLNRDDVARSWIEIPAPMSSPNLPPACWAQNADDAPPESGPEHIELVPVFPVEPAIPGGVEAVGWNGVIGGHDPRPRVQALGVNSTQSGSEWRTNLLYWDTPSRGHSRAVRQQRATLVEAPTDCVWPTVLSAEVRDLQLYDLVGRTERGCDVKVNLQISLPDNAEGVQLFDGEIRLGTEVVGSWDGPSVELSAGQVTSLTCTIALHKLREAADGRLLLTLVFAGCPLRGVVRGEHVFRTNNGPWSRLLRSRADGGTLRSPWLSIDLGTEGSCASVAFLDGYQPRVVSVDFDDGPIYPSRVHLSPDLTGAWSLTERPREDSLYTGLVKMGLRFGDGAHPGCPDHIAATEVTRFFLKRFLLEVKERMAWFPLEDADVLVSFPPRLASMPTFVRALRDTFQEVLREVIWTANEPKRLRFREEGFLVAVPALYKDLEVQPLAPGHARYYWVMDFGGGTTDVCGFLCTADEWGEEHTVSHLTYPQRLAHHLAGNDVTRAFYATLLGHLARSGVVAGAGQDLPAHSLRFPFPATPYPSAKSTPTALANQACLRELADALKCTPPHEQPGLTLRSLAGSLGRTTILTVDEVATTLMALLAGEARELGLRTVADLHAEVLDPGGTADDSKPTSHPLFEQGPTGVRPRRSSDKAHVRCTQCNEMHTLPLWAFASNRAFRFRCRACGYAQRAQLADSVVPESDSKEAPTILDYRDSRVEQSPRSGTGELYVEQDGRSFLVKNWTTLRRWVSERRVGPDDLFSEGGIAWVPLGEHPELQPLFAEAQGVVVDETRGPALAVAEVRTVSAPPVEPRTNAPGRAGLNRDVDLFLSACNEALGRAMLALPEGEETEVVVLVAGRASRFGPIARKVQERMPGRVVHLTNAWARKNFGNTGQIDPGSDLKTLTANGAGLFAVLQTNAETSNLVLSFDTHIMDVPVYLQPASNTRPWMICPQLDLREGATHPLVSTTLDRPPISDVELGTSAAEPMARALPADTPLAGDLKLVVEGLSEDRDWAPYVTIAEGTARRQHGRRPRTTRDTTLRTESGEFVLGPLSIGEELVFTRLLETLELLGSDS